MFFGSGLTSLISLVLIITIWAQKWVCRESSMPAYASPEKIAVLQARHGKAKRGAQISCTVQWNKGDWSDLLLGCVKAISSSGCLLPKIWNSNLISLYYVVKRMWQDWNAVIRFMVQRNGLICSDQLSLKEPKMLWHHKWISSSVCQTNAGKQDNTLPLLTLETKLTKCISVWVDLWDLGLSQTK